MRASPAGTAPAVPIGQWRDASYRLKFVLGEYCFYSTWFRAVEVTAHVTRLLDSLDATTRAVLPLIVRHGAVVIPSHPISVKPAWLSVARDHLRYVPAASVHYFIQPGGSFDHYLCRVPRKHRHELARKLRRFAKYSGGEIDLRVHRSVAEAKIFYPAACALSRNTYQHRLLDAGLAETAEFEAELLRQAERDAMRGYLLLHRGTAIAYAYCSVTGDCLTFRCIGYDPAFRDLAAGLILIYEALRAAINEGCFAVIDFGPGEAQYKRAFATGSLRCASVFLFRPTLRHLAMIVTHRGCAAVSEGCALLLTGLGIKQRIKRFFRARAGSRRGATLSRT